MRTSTERGVRSAPVAARPALTLVGADEALEGPAITVDHRQPGGVVHLAQQVPGDGRALQAGAEQLIDLLAAGFTAGELDGATVGLIDDFGALTPKPKALGQVVAVFVLLKSGIMIAQTPPRLEENIKDEVIEIYRSILMDDLGFPGDVLP